MRNKFKELIIIGVLFSIILSGCGKEVQSDQKEIQYKNDFEIADYERLQKEDEFETKIYLQGEIVRIDEDYDLVVRDAEENEWKIFITSEADFSEYLNKKCEIYGWTDEFLFAKMKLPSISVYEKENCRIIFGDGKVYNENDVSQCAEFKQRPNEEQVEEDELNDTNDKEASRETDNRDGENSVSVPESEEIGENLVWIPTNGGTKYHRKSNCSKMEDPMQVSLDTAIANGYEACKRCY